MVVLSLLLEACGLLGFTWALLARYRDAYVSTVGLVAVFISWALGFVGMLLLPIDIARHSHALVELDDTEDVEDDDNSSADLPGFLRMWQVLYWLTFALSWLVLPLLVEFSQDGEFRWERRLVGSFRRLVLHWTILVAVAAAVVVYLIASGHFTAQGLIGLAMASANTYGFVWLIVLLGHGLVDVPRSLWVLRYPEFGIRSLNFRAAQVHHERMEAIFLYQDVLREVRSYYDRMLQAEGASIILTSEMLESKAGLDVVMALAEAEERHPGCGGSTTSINTMVAKIRPTTSPMLSTSTMNVAPPPYSAIVELHRRVKAAQAELRGTEQAWLELCLRSEALRRQVATSGAALPPAGLYSAENIASQVCALAAATRTEVQRSLMPQLWGIGACVAASGSLCILWGELTMTWSPKLSLFHLLFEAGLAQPSAMELIALVLLLYMVICAYSTLFKLRSFGRFALRGHRNSSELALLKTSIHQCRLQFALGHNFLLLVNEPKLTDATAFHRLWSHMQVVRMFGRAFSVYAPILMVALVACTAGNVYARVMKQVIGMEQYEQLLPGNAAHEAQIAKGEQLLRKGREKLRRRKSEAGRPGHKETQWRGRGVATQEMAASLLDSGDQQDDDECVA